jgi:hypothetical protein
MAVTPNYSWPIPVATDLVKDGYAAIADLGDAIDTTVFGLGGSGLTLISTTTIGTTVSSVTVTGAFSATYENYKIIVSDGVSSAGCDLAMKLGATTTAYYFSRMYCNVQTSGTTFQGIGNTTSFAYIGKGSASGLMAIMDVLSPFTAKPTNVTAAISTTTTSGDAGTFAGVLTNTTSYTDFTITPNTGTLTGGTIRVYGYAK